MIYVSQNDDNKLCLICHEDIWRNGGGVQELQCMHRFHKEVKHYLHLFLGPSIENESLPFGACQGHGEGGFIFEYLLFKLGRPTQPKS